MDNKQCNDENQANFGLLNDDGRVYKKTTRTTERNKQDFIKLVLILMTTGLIISTVCVTTFYILNERGDDYSLEESSIENSKPTFNAFKKIRTKEDMASPPETVIHMEVNPDIDVHLIVEQIINRRKLSLRLGQNDSISVMEPTSLPTEQPKVIDYLLATIVINGGRVPNTDGMLGVTDPFVKAFVDHRLIGQTPTQKENLTPAWNYQIAHNIKVETNSVLDFEIWDSDKYTTHERIGHCSLPMSHLMSNQLNGKIVNMEFNEGELRVTVNWVVVYKNQ